MITVFGNSCELFPNEIEKAVNYAKALLFSGAVMNFEEGGRNFIRILKDAITNNRIIRIYSPKCMRYYYDEKGDQQVIGTIRNFHYIGADNKGHFKSGSRYTSELENSLFISKVLSSFGISVEVIIPVMDNELLRPKIMNTETNRLKIMQFIKELSQYTTSFEDSNIKLRVVSSLSFFGDPFAEGYVPDESDTDEEKIEYIKNLGISKKTFDTGVEGELARNRKDSSRNKYYLSEDFAILSELYGLLEAYFQGVKMARIEPSENCSGVIIGIPNGAGDLMSIFKKVNGISPFYEKKLV
ncbi:hypothetical protein M0R04_03125 [Candidatus Dojkabacteria bacterium]|nr:hypothetical protein [Candidatus Dojkabacteria bacterium]